MIWKCFSRRRDSTYAVRDEVVVQGNLTAVIKAELSTWVIVDGGARNFNAQEESPRVLR